MRRNHANSLFNIIDGYGYIYIYVCIKQKFTNENGHTWPIFSKSVGHYYYCYTLIPKLISNVDDGLRILISYNYNCFSMHWTLYTKRHTAYRALRRISFNGDGRNSRSQQLCAHCRSKCQRQCSRPARSPLGVRHRRPQNFVTRIWITFWCNRSGARLVPASHRWQNSNFSRPIRQLDSIRHRL